MRLMQLTQPPHSANHGDSVAKPRVFEQRLLLDVGESQTTGARSSEEGGGYPEEAGNSRKGEEFLRQFPAQAWQCDS